MVSLVPEAGPGAPNTFLEPDYDTKYNYCGGVGWLDE